MEIQIGDRLVEATLLNKNGNKVSIDIDGKIYDVDICMFASGQCSVIKDGISYNPFIVHNDGSKHYSVSLNYSTYEIDMLDSQAKYMRMHKKAISDEQKDIIKAPMPSKIIKVFVEPGQKLKAGEHLLTIEAMKMQSTIIVSQDCRVKTVSCKVGDSVLAEQVLVTLSFDED